MRVLADAINVVREINPQIQVVLTVSPVRHTREGVVENSRSKAGLLLAAHELAETLPNVTYFPAYEFLVDELRDYRWYEEDLVHPSSAAVRRLFRHFAAVFLSGETREVLEEVRDIKTAVEHRPIVAGSAAYMKHLSTTLSRISAAEKKYAKFGLDLSSERAAVDSALQSLREDS